MKKAVTVSLLLLFSVLFISCAVDNVEPESYGVIKGRVLDSKTEKGIAFASITTNPGTEAVLTDKTGSFTLTHLAVGDYLVQVTKEGYQSESVRVTVSKSDTTSAQILLDVDKDSNPPQDYLDAVVNSFFNNTTDGDTTFVEVNYSIRNSSDNEVVSNYEIYFKIYTSQDNFFYEVAGDSLHAGQEDVGSFKKHIRNYVADSVVITDIYAPTS